MTKGKTFTFDIGKSYTFGIENVEVKGTVTQIEEDVVFLTDAYEYSRTNSHLRYLGTVPVLREEVRWIKYA